MDAGRLVDDQIVLGMIRERLAEPDTGHGFILDGFPRNLAQAHALDAMLAELGKPLDAVVQMDVDYGELTRRISGRRTCRDCDRVFNVLTGPPGQAESEVCPKTGIPHRLFQRPDDNETTVAERLRVYDEKTKPLIQFYRDHGILRSINAEGRLEEVTERLEKALQSASTSTGLAPAAG
jgi:adenylate kinase